MKFKEGIDLSNATIDKKSLKSLLPSLDKTMVEDKEIKTEGLKLSSLNLSKEERAEFEKSAFGKQYLATIEENSKTIEEDKKVLILMKQVRSHFKEEEGIDENLFKLAERNVRQAVRLEVVKGEEEFKKISHPTVFVNLLRKFGHFDKSNQIFHPIVNQEFLNKEISGSLRTANFLKEFSQPSRGIKHQI